MSSGERPLQDAIIGEEQSVPERSEGVGGAMEWGSGWKLVRIRFGALDTSVGPSGDVRSTSTSVIGYCGPRGLVSNSSLGESARDKGKEERKEEEWRGIMPVG